MRKVLIALVTAALLAGSAAFAQGMGASFNSNQYAGIGVGYPFQVFYGMNNVFGNNIGVRVRLSSYFWNISLGADVLANVANLDSAPISFYAGGGPNVDYLFLGGVNSLGIGVSGVVGGEYKITDNIGAFLELGAGYTYYFGSLSGLNAFGLGFAPRGAIGVNYHF